MPGCREHRPPSSSHCPPRRGRASAPPNLLPAVALFLLIVVWPIAGMGKGDVEKIKKEMHSVRQDLQKTSNKKKQARRELEQLRQSIGRNNAELKKFDRRNRVLREEIRALGVKQQNLVARIGEGRATLARMIRFQWQSQNALRSEALLGLQGHRAATLYLPALIQAQNTLMRQLETLQSGQQKILAKIQGEQNQVTTLGTARKALLEKLGQEQRQSQQLLASLDHRLQTGQQRLAALREDEKRLTRLLRALKKKPLRQPPPQRHKSSPSQQSPDDGSTFGRMKGLLRFPLQGTIPDRPPANLVSHRGIFIEAPGGQEIRAIGDGQVVYAGTLRGYGQVLIVDHGSGYLSIYGSCDRLARGVGDKIGQGEVIATSGSTGSQNESGLYFEIRHNGTALNPMDWLKLP